MVVYDELNEMMKMMMNYQRMHDFHRRVQLQVHDGYLVPCLLD